MKLSRRDLLKVAAGSAVGILFTPVPWKTLDDSAIWTQNWPWTPVPPRGEPVFKTTACALCPAGCGVRARCINTTPIHLAGLDHHPYGQGSLCAIGLAGHHLPFHPARLRHPLRRIIRRDGVESTPQSHDQAFAAIAEAIRARAGQGSVTILDQRPGRSLSGLYRAFAAAVPAGSYVLPPAVEDGTAQALTRLTGGTSTFGPDLGHCATILSIGTPLLDGWGSPGRMATLLGTGAIHLIQAEPCQSRTATHADTWLPLKPGTETALILGIASALLESHATLPASMAAPGAAFIAAARAFTPARAGEVTGLGEQAIRATATRLATAQPALVLGGGDAGAGPLGREEQDCIAGLNSLLGTVGVTGGFLPRSAVPELSPVSTLHPLTLEAVPDHSIAVLILDGSENGSALPWRLVEQKLINTSPFVVSFSPYVAGLARQADMIVPFPALYESWEELPTPHDAARASFGLAAPLFTTPAGGMDPCDIVRGIASGLGITLESGTLKDFADRRVDALFQAKRGEVVLNGTTRPVTEFASASALGESLGSGGVWMETATPTAHPLPAFPDAEAVNRLTALLRGRLQVPAGELTVLPHGWKNTAATGSISPIISKLFQESGLRPEELTGSIHPSTVARLGLVEGASAVLQGAQAQVRITVRADRSVMPDVVQVAVGPDPEAINQRGPGGMSVYAICPINTSAWRIARAAIGRA